MSYVPIVPSTPPPPPSRQTRELADLLGRVIQEYENAHPTITSGEVRAALRLALRASAKARGDAGPVVAVAAGLAVVVAGVVLFAVMGAGDAAPGVGFRPSVVVGLVAVVVAVLAVILSRRSP